MRRARSEAFLGAVVGRLGSSQQAFNGVLCSASAEPLRPTAHDFRIAVVAGLVRRCTGFESGREAALACVYCAAQNIATT